MNCKKGDSGIYITTMNIGNPSLIRAKEQLKWLLEHSADIYILTESKNSSGCKYISNKMQIEGWKVCFPIPNDNNLGVMVICRSEITRTEFLFEKKDELYGRYVEVDTVFNGQQVTIIGIYVPSNNRTESYVERKKRCLEMLSSRFPYLPKMSIICGDFNIIERGHLPKYRTFFKWEYDFFDVLKTCGFVDAYKYLYPHKQIYSWIGRTGNGYRYDYIFLTERCKEMLTDCKYLSSIREGTYHFTDHSAVEIELNIN